MGFGQGASTSKGGSEDNKDGNAESQRVTWVISYGLRCVTAMQQGRFKRFERLRNVFRYYMLDICMIQSSLPPYKIAVVQVQ